MWVLGGLQRYVDTRGALLPEAERVLLGHWQSSRRALYEVVSVQPGRGLVLRELNGSLEVKLARPARCPVWSRSTSSACDWCQMVSAHLTTLGGFRVPRPQRATVGPLIESRRRRGVVAVAGGPHALASRPDDGRRGHPLRHVHLSTAGSGGSGRGAGPRSCDSATTASSASSWCGVVANRDPQLDHHRGGLRDRRGQCQATGRPTGADTSESGPGCEAIGSHRKRPWSRPRRMGHPMTPRATGSRS